MSVFQRLMPSFPSDVGYFKVVLFHPVHFPVVSRWFGRFTPPFEAVLLVPGGFRLAFRIKEIHRRGDC